MNTNKIEDLEQNKGHRQRLKTLFNRAKIRTLDDYEVLEMILYLTIKRRDTKIIAKNLLFHFGSLAGVCFADGAELEQVPGIGAKTIEYLRLLSDLFSRVCLPIQLERTHVLSDWVAVVQYCRLTMGFKKCEAFRCLFLNKKNYLIADHLLDYGTIDKVAVYPREIARAAVVYGAAAAILVHNHPSGDSSPSSEDINITNQIAESLKAVNVSMHDHLVVSQDDCFSFRANSLL